MEILTKYAIEIFFGLVSAGALAFCKYLWGKNQKLEEMQRADQNRQYRDMVLNEIEPIVEDLGRLKMEIARVDNAAKTALDNFSKQCDLEHKKMYEDLYKVQNENRKNLELIVNSYKYRLIQLCKTHLRDGYITDDDFEQISEFYKLYRGLGGNGQAQEYYDKVLELDMIRNA